MPSKITRILWAVFIAGLYWGGCYVTLEEPIEFWLLVPTLTGAQVIEVYRVPMIVGLCMMVLGYDLHRLVKGECL